MAHILESLGNLFGDFLYLVWKGDKKKPQRRWFFLIPALGLLLELTLWRGVFGLSRGEALAVREFLVFSAPVWIPLFLGAIFVQRWIQYIRSDFIAKSGSVLLEIRLPRELMKSPKAMEVVFTSIWQKGSVTFVDTYWDGKVRPWYSFELASFGGEVHFYVWTLPKFRDIVEAQIYAQYPTVEIYEVPDYTARFKYDPPRNFMWGTHFQLTLPDPYPIKTYVDYGLDRTGDEEEEKVDPLTSMLEYLGSIKKGEQLWFQILIRAHTPLGLVEGHLFRRPDWKQEAKDEVNNIMLRHPETKSSRQFTEAGFPIIPTLTEDEKEQVNAIERSVGKFVYETAIRGCFMTEEKLFDRIPIVISGLIGAFRQYSSNTLNGFRLGWFTDIMDETKDLLWLLGLRAWAIRKFQPKYAERMIDAFRRRSFFYQPYRNFRAEPFLLTTEELATIFHFPGQVAATPTVGRVPSKKVEPPPNLPV